MADRTLSVNVKESFIKTVVLDPAAGSDFGKVASEAFHLARDQKIIVEFSFNETKVTINARGW